MASTSTKESPNTEIIADNCETKVIKVDTKVLFIEAKTIGSGGRQPKSMQLAFTTMKFYKFSTNWIKEEEVLTKQWSENSDNFLFILESFDGKVFDYLWSKKLRIISPLTVLYCYSKECPKPFKSIPVKPFPVFSQCMRKLFVSISGFDGQKKEEMTSKITRMCGNFSKDFTKNVTHLVTDSVRTKKYRVAKEKGVAVLSSLWIDRCWTESQHNLLSANDPQLIDEFRLKMFSKLLISVSQIENSERKTVERMVNENGGQYSPSLKLSDPNSILLLRTPDGDKFKYAQLRSVPCLNIQWLFDSHAKGYALSEEDYLIRLSSQSSQKSESKQKPIKPSDDNQKDVTIITINPLNNSSETVDTTATIETTDNSSEDKINRLKTDSNIDSILEGCDVFITGFERPVFETIKSALIQSGAMVYNEFKNLVTHVIAGPKCDDTELDQYFNNKSCKIVSMDWVLECFKLNECCDCRPFQLDKPKKSIVNNVSNGSQKRKRKADDIFAGPLTVVLPKKAHKALEKWREDSKIDSNRNHKSLGDKLNNREQLEISWSQQPPEDDGVLSQRSYREEVNNN